MERKVQSFKRSPGEFKKNGLSLFFRLRLCLVESFGLIHRFEKIKKPKDIKFVSNILFLQVLKSLLYDV